MEITEILQEAAKAGGEVLKKYFQTELEHIIKSSPGDFATKADLESQEVIVRILKDLMTKNGIPENEIGFIGEESLNHQAKHTFIIDPLDGTAYFAAGEDRFTVSIAYAENQEIKAGIVYQPLKEISYFAKKDEGSYLIKNGEKVKLKIEYNPLSTSVVSMNIGSNPKTAQGVLKIAYNLAPQVVRIRERACVSLSACDIALNEYHSVFNGKCFIWDIAAAKLVIEEAGGIITGWDDTELKIDIQNPNKSYRILSGHPKLIKEMLPYFKNG